MKTIRLLALLTVATLAASCVRAPAAVAPQGVAFARIQRSNESGASQRFFGNYRLSSGWKEVDQATASAIAAEIDEALAAELKEQAARAAAGPGAIRVTPLCVPDPGFAIRLPTSAGHRDVAVCLECSFIAIHDPDGRTTEIWIDQLRTARIKRYYDEQIGG